MPARRRVTRCVTPAYRSRLPDGYLEEYAVWPYTEIGFSTSPRVRRKIFAGLRISTRSKPAVSSALTNRLRTTFAPIGLYRDHAGTDGPSESQAGSPKGEHACLNPIDAPHTHNATIKMATRLLVNPATKELPVFVGYKGFQVFFPRHNRSAIR